MKCVIYKGRKKADTYLYVQQEGEFECVPDNLLALLGELEQVMQLELEPGRTLARVDADQVCEHLQAQGFYLQMPATDAELLEAALKKISDDG